MRLFNFILISLLLLFGVALEGYGQNVTYYTSNGTCDPNNPNYFSDGSCWDVTENSCSTSLFPPLNTSISDCIVIIDLNHEINIDNLTISATNLIRINVNAGVTLNLSGNLNIDKGANFRIFHYDGSKINISGSINIGTGSGNSLANIRIGGTSSNGAGIYANGLDFGNRSRLRIDSGGVLVINGPTSFAANDIEILNEGFFRTRTLVVEGKSSIANQGDGVIIIDEDLVLRGNAQLEVVGNAEVEVGGNIDITNATGNCSNGNCEPLLTVSDNGAVRVCGPSSTYPPADGSKIVVDPEDPDNGFFPYYGGDACRILPVEYIYTEAKFFIQSRSSIISWATAKEWESSHFEIERAVEGLKFEKIGEIKSAGWSDKIIEYEFEDTNLPLTGGNLLYRLKQVDLNGNFQYSQVLSVRIPGVEFTSGVWRAYPNPTYGNELRINLMDASLYNNEALTFRLIHPMVQTLPMTVTSESEMNEVLSDLSRRMPKGVFVVEIQWGQKVEHIKVLKQ